MDELLTAAQMRAIETAAIDSVAVTGLELMERAGAGMVDAILDAWADGALGGPAPQTPRGICGQKKQAVVLCGPGNNGGDGFVVARLLHQRGWDVQVFATETRTPDARANRVRWEALGPVRALTRDAVAVAGSDALCIDAIFGTGLSRPVSGALGEVLRCLADIAAQGARIVAVDIPSGLSSDSGEIPGWRGEGLAPCPRCALTVTFHARKVGHVLARGPEYCGRVAVKSIGIEPWAGLIDGQDRVRLVMPPSAKVVGKCASGHKFVHGHALVLAGGVGRTGAARLAARGALRIGAGLVTLGVPPAAQMEVAAQITALMLRRVEDAAGLSRLLEDPRLTALCLGPGLGLDRAQTLVPVALGRAEARTARRPGVVLDADALSAFAGAPAELFAMLHDKCVLTPHAGEFGRLFPDMAERLRSSVIDGGAFSKVEATREAAARAGCIVLFKGPDTVIAAPDGHCSVHAAAYERAAPWLATAGAGDVLAGFVAGLLARGMDAFAAAETAAWLHVECARAFGPGLIAEDLPEMLPGVLRELAA